MEYQYHVLFCVDTGNRNHGNSNCLRYHDPIASIPMLFIISNEAISELDDTPMDILKFQIIMLTKLCEI